MKSNLLSYILLTMIALFSAQTVGAQGVIVHKKDGTTIKVPYSELDSISTYLVDEDPHQEHEYVDLGLPSGIKWATCNLGASKPEEYGGYYGWGCTEPYKNTDKLDWTLYFQMIGGTGTSEEDCGTYWDPLRDYVYPNNKSIAGTLWDAARAKLGGKWRMPTTDEQQELMDPDNCTWTWTTQNGVNGYEVISNKNGNSIFLPAAGERYDSSLYHAGSCGYYWSSIPFSPFLYYASGASFMRFYSDRHVWDNWNGNYRNLGYSIRPVSE